MKILTGVVKMVAGEKSFFRRLTCFAGERTDGSLYSIGMSPDHVIIGQVEQFISENIPEMNGTKGKFEGKLRRFCEAEKLFEISYDGVNFSITRMFRGEKFNPNRWVAPTPLQKQVLLTVGEAQKSSNSGDTIGQDRHLSDRLSKMVGEVTEETARKLAVG